MRVTSAVVSLQTVALTTAIQIHRTALTLSVAFSAPVGSD